MPPHFLLVDDNPEGRFIVSKTLLRHFPQARITEIDDSADAIEALKSEPVAAALVHKTLDLDGLSLVKRLREVAPGLVIVYLSGNQKLEAAAEFAGATKFLHYDRWLMIGTLVADLIKRGTRPPI